MDAEERFNLLARNAEEIVTAEELKNVLATNPSPRAYIGFEPSGLVHLGWALVANKIKDLVDAEFEVIIFFADWHAYINDKLGGDIERIRVCARYMEDCFEALGVPRDKVKFVFASEIMDMGYWEIVMKVGKVTSLSRIKRAMTIMRRLAMRLSTMRTAPSLNFKPTVVVPLLTASLAYSTWNSLPSGENTVMALSYAICPGCINVTP